MDQFYKIKKLVGNTPLIEYSDTINVKFEIYNPTGSIKDRILFYIIENAINNGSLDIKHKQGIIEASSGNTGISTAFVSSLLGLKSTIILPRNMSEERKQIIKSFGSELLLVNDGDFDKAIELRNKLCKSNNYFNINQFHNKLNIECHYNTTGNEIIEQMKNKTIDILINGTGTGGTIMGVGKKLREHNPNLKIVVVEPAESPVMSGGNPGLHNIQGIGDGSKFLVDLDFIDEIVLIKSDDAIKKAKELCKNGFFVGISSAANILASEKYAKKYPDSNIVTFFPDSGDRYISLYNKCDSLKPMLQL